jgi:hypothetical protein
VYRSSGAMSILGAEFLNTLLVPYATHDGAYFGQQKDSQDRRQHCVEFREDLSAVHRQPSKTNDSEPIPPNSSPPFSICADTSHSSTGHANVLTTNPTSRDSRLQGGLNALAVADRKLLQILRLLESSLKKLIFIGLFKVVEALSIHAPPGYIEGCEGHGVNLWRELSKNSIPVLQIFAECVVISVVDVDVDHNDPSPMVYGCTFALCPISH